MTTQPGAPGLFHVVVMDPYRGFAVRMTREPLGHIEAITFREKLRVDALRGRGRWSAVVQEEDFTSCPAPGCGNGWAFRQKRRALCPECDPAGLSADDAPTAAPVALVSAAPQPPPARSAWAPLFDEDIDFGDHD